MNFKKMKYALLIIATLMCCAFTTSEQPTNPQVNGTVYICTGPQSKRFHKTPNCRGLGSCSKEIKAVSIEVARKMGRTPCGWCYK